MTETKESQHNHIATAPRALTAVPPVRGPRPGSFWQRWKEWERDHGTMPSPARNRAA